MRFLISYVCRNEEGLFSDQFEFEAEQKPTNTDQVVIEAALKNSLDFHKSGMAGLSITSVLPIS